MLGCVMLSVALSGCGEPAPDSSWESKKTERPADIKIDENGDK
jgi:hypothetical protein